MSFLSARWEDLVMVNYKIAPEILEPFVPVGTALDFHDSNCYISLVAFLFKNTKVLGIPWPGHVNFEEVNLRFYVKRETANETRRGVVFIKEIVPKPMISLIANALYKENYTTMKMGHAHTQHSIKYTFGKKQTDQYIQVELDDKLIEIENGSHEEFITEHYWGYAHKNKITSNEYEVVHPRWEQRKVKNHDIHINFHDTYGKEFEFLQEEKPYSVLYCAGSHVTVEPANEIH